MVHDSASLVVLVLTVILLALLVLPHSQQEGGDFSRAYAEYRECRKAPARAPCLSDHVCPRPKGGSKEPRRSCLSVPEDQP